MDSSVSIIQNKDLNVNQESNHHHHRAAFWAPGNLLTLTAGCQAPRNHGEASGELQAVVACRMDSSRLPRERSLNPVPASHGRRAADVLRRELFQPPQEEQAEPPSGGPGRREGASGQP